MSIRGDEIQRHKRHLDTRNRKDIPAGDALVERAKVFAAAAHAAVKQLRKYTGEPYFVHPKAVAKIVESVAGISPAAVAAAYLHDVIEDTGVELPLIVAMFGFEVAYLVECLTDISKPEDGNRKLRKSMDRQHTEESSSEAKTVKLADLIDNSLSIETSDPDFWRVYRHEKIATLAVLKAGDRDLWNRAAGQVGIDERI